ncbi:hypothetical protein NQ318_016465 [Aromia moschata]|uniref:SDE2-like domain-containing protein n=1 Tax=Aromia moschata TaxID=1265417 RepID=A0AAV8Z453_9CUCU|nr:hypothetical protein NQ318_016465 [Aromia moschata]
MEIILNNKLHLIVYNRFSCSELIEYINSELGLKFEEYYLLSNGKKIENHRIIEDGAVHIIPKVLGGKGGFGSMLRAIGAQIEKTTNREACRDLSGRRLRDINEEQRLKNWINQQAEREKEAKERKKKKLERLCEQPKHEFRDEEYDKERSELPEKVEDAVLQGLQASCSSKRKPEDKKDVVKKKKAKLWVDDELDQDLSNSEDESNSDLGDEKPGTSSSSPQLGTVLKDGVGENSNSNSEKVSPVSNNGSVFDESIENTLNQQETTELTTDSTENNKDNVKETVPTSNEKKNSLKFLEATDNE